MYLLNPNAIVEDNSLVVDRLSDRLKNSFNSVYVDNTTKLEKLSLKLDALSPLKVLSRGFAIAQKDETIIKSVNQLSDNDKISLKFSDGVADCVVVNTDKK